MFLNVQSTLHTEAACEVHTMQTCYNTCTAEDIVEFQNACITDVSNEMIEILLVTHETMTAFMISEGLKIMFVRFHLVFTVSTAKFAHVVVSTSVTKYL